ncbi:putative SAUR-like auxin-responsive protein family [Hibiscus syriacus]|uniref:SAUR-like auxin-responsive protein family n=1 Tax=Hibiscus syriacus TaxID=106335 RepID=A0A6A3AW04_HIBSY|nr:putative SAUR-like auxin-responsive protein family [Hibiscus syriacus]
MTARVSSSLEQSQNNIHTGNSGILVTKDLLGNLSKAKADLEFEGGIEAQKCSSSSPKSPLSDGKTKNPLTDFLKDSKLQDLNFPPINLFDEMTTSLDLKLQSVRPKAFTKASAHWTRSNTPWKEQKKEP